MMSRQSKWISLELADLSEALCLTRGPLPPNIHLREADQALDLPQIAALYNRVYSHECGSDDTLSTEQLAQLVWHPGLSPKGAFLALDGNRVVGLGVASTESPRTGHAQGAIELLTVLPGYRQRGIGRALLHAALTWLAERKVMAIRAIVDQPGPLAILQHYGFVPVSSSESDQEE
jgi:GNAT superfamily N-acetyltransferase